MSEEARSPLSLDEILALKTGERVTVTWDGGNGPHEYEIRNDLDAWQLYRTAGATSTKELSDGYNDVRRVTPPHATATEQGTK